MLVATVRVPVSGTRDMRLLDCTRCGVKHNLEAVGEDAMFLVARVTAALNSIASIRRNQKVNAASKILDPESRAQTDPFI